MTEPTKPRHNQANPTNAQRPEPTASFQIRVVDGEEGERLARQQASVFLEIAQWQARQQAPTTDDAPPTDP
ncbi:hypothetical protein [Nocardia wallacei]|nr:hypothetical protein [Nocardia wallacei]